MMKSHSFVLGCLILPLFVLAGCGGPASIISLHGQASASATISPCNSATQWKLPAGNVQLDDVAMVSTNEGWAIGNTTPYPFALGTPQPAGVLYHFIGGQWVRLSQTYPATSLVALSMDSPTDGWAVSTPTMSGVNALVLHYSSGQWHSVDVPALNGPSGAGDGQIGSISVQMFGPGAGWMFAWSNASRDPSNPAARTGVIMLRFEHRVWTPIAAPPVTITTQIFALSAVSADEAWIVGTDYANGANLRTVFAHYVDGAWSLWPKTFPGNSDQSITMLSPTDGWAAYSGDSGDQTVMLHYDGTMWAPVPTPSQWASQRVQLSSQVFGISPGVTWFGAYRVSPGSYTYAPLLEQYANGQWEQVAWPFSMVRLQTIAAVSGSELWGVGNISHQEGCALAGTDVEQGVFLHFQQGQWSEQVLP